MWTGTTPGFSRRLEKGNTHQTQSHKRAQNPRPRSTHEVGKSTSDRKRTGPAKQVGPEQAESSMPSVIAQFLYPQTIQALDSQGAYNQTFRAVNGFQESLDIVKDSIDI